MGKVVLHRIVTVLDAEHVLDYNSIFSSDRELIRTLRRQIEVADIIVGNKFDLISNRTADKVKALVRDRNGSALFIQSVRCEIDGGHVLDGITASGERRQPVISGRQPASAGGRMAAETVRTDQLAAKWFGGGQLATRRLGGSQLAAQQRSFSQLTTQQLGGSQPCQCRPCSRTARRRSELILPHPNGCDLSRSRGGEHLPPPVRSLRRRQGQCLLARQRLYALRQAWQPHALPTVGQAAGMVAGQLRRCAVFCHDWHRSGRSRH